MEDRAANPSDLVPPTHVQILSSVFCGDFSESERTGL